MNIKDIIPYRIKVLLHDYDRLREERPDEIDKTVEQIIGEIESIENIPTRSAYVNSWWQGRLAKELEKKGYEFKPEILDRISKLFKQ